MQKRLRKSIRQGNRSRLFSGLFLMKSSLGSFEDKAIEMSRDLNGA